MSPIISRGQRLDDVQLARELGYEIQRIDIAGLDGRQTRAIVWREVVSAVLPLAEPSRIG